MLLLYLMETSEGCPVSIFYRTFVSSLYILVLGMGFGIGSRSQHINVSFSPGSKCGLILPLLFPSESRSNICWLWSCDTGRAMSVSVVIYSPSHLKRCRLMPYAWGRRGEEEKESLLRKSFFKSTLYCLCHLPREKHKKHLPGNMRMAYKSLIRTARNHFSTLGMDEAEVVFDERG